MYRESFSKSLRKILKENKTTLRKVSNELNIPSNTMYYYLNGVREIRLENLCKLADYFDISLDELCGRKEY